MTVKTRLRPQRGSGLLVAMLALLALIIASTGAMVALVVAHSQRVTYQHHGVQALYLAEMGVEEMLATATEGSRPPAIERTIRRSPEPDERVAIAPDSSRDERAGPVPSGTVVGSYRVSAHLRGGALVVGSTGGVAAPNGRLVTREVRVVCRRQAGRWVRRSWEQTP